jgi:hypothetical protein
MSCAHSRWGRSVARNLAVCLLLLAPAGVSRGADDGPGEFFEKQVRPILVERCSECHGAARKPKGGLRLISRESVLKGGDSGPAVVIGKPSESLLIDAIHYIEEPKMPPTAKLSEREIETLTRWVTIGLPWPEADAAKLPAAAADTRPEFKITDEQRRFWSFQPIKRVPPPAVKDAGWPRSDIDRFILAALEKRDLKPAAASDRRTFIRRATYDLTGLPPTPAEVEAFVADTASDAFDSLIDRLLASPRYGERWGRHWLDLVRYTDSFDARIAGSNNEMDINDSWRYRDWVVDAFNRDMPYDQFVTHQIAGDLLPAGEPGDLNIDGTIATGLLAIGNWGGGDADKEKLLTDIADDQVDVVSRAFMGLTVACARCHDHKFDPISTKDYYGLAGIFFSTHILPNVGPKTNGPPMLRIPLVSKAENAARERYSKSMKDLESKLKQAQTRSSEAEEAESAAEARASLAKIRDEIESLKKKPPLPVRLANGAREGGVPGSPHAGVHDVRVHVRGSYARLGDLVPRHFPAIVEGESPPKIVEGSGRLELARWLTAPEHPLTARVMANRVWQQHFGAGIVRTSSNFGKLGERPTHPELLDDLARNFVEGGWSIKRLHRAIMLSATYRQSSEADPATFQADPDNRLFGRMNRRRLDAESIRDSLLFAANRLDLSVGGPSTRDPNVPRRSLYLMTIRSDRSSFGPLFDAADPTAMVDIRTISTVAPQALYLLNNAFVVDQARALAKRLTGDNEARIDRAHAILFGRPPTEEERQVARDSLAAFARAGGADSAWPAYCHVLLCTNEWIYTD